MDNLTLPNLVLEYSLEHLRVSLTLVVAILESSSIVASLLLDVKEPSQSINVVGVLGAMDE